MFKEMQVLKTAIKQAGTTILQMQKSGCAVSQKENNDIVTQADLAANDILQQSLLSNFPDYGWLSEENVDEPKRLQQQRVWIVDPIDGTKEFARGLDEYAISVCLVEESQPVLAAIYQPVKEKLFYALRGRGAWLNDVKLTCNNNEEEKINLLASRSEYSRGEWCEYLRFFNITPLGSIAYKLALVAEGKAHATMSFGYKNEWDIAAGTLLVMEAGGKVTKINREPIIFNQTSTKVKGIVAASSFYHQKIFGLLDPAKLSS